MFIIEHYFSSLLYVHIQGKFQEIYPNSPVPHKTTFLRLVECCHESGSVSDEKFSGKPCVLTNAVTKSVRKLASQACIFVPVNFSFSFLEG